jgi:hypothetical protein
MAKSAHPAHNSRSSLASSARSTAAALLILRKRKEDLLEIPGSKSSLAPQALERATAEQSAGGQKDQSIANAFSFCQLMDREDQRSAAVARLPQQGHHLLRLAQVQAIERFV